MISLLSSAAHYGHVFPESVNWTAICSSLVEAAGRSLLLAAAVALGLRVLGIRNVVAQKSAWTLVLFSSLLMPVLAPWATGLRGLPRAAMLVLPVDGWFSSLRAGVVSMRRAAPAAQGPALGSEYRSLPPTEREGVPVPVDTYAHTSTQDRGGAPAANPEGSLTASAPSSRIAQVAPLEKSSETWTVAGDHPLKPGVRLSLRTLAMLSYLLVAGVLLVRLFWGIFIALRLWCTAEPVQFGALSRSQERRVRWSVRINSPVTVGSGILLPADCAEWDTQKLRIVLAHEQSHVRQGDFYLQALAGVYAAVFWFNPLGWWLKHRLSDLGEAISDRAGLDQAGSSTSYARILLQFAAMPNRTRIGVAMARNGNFSHRIEWLLNEARVRQAFAGGKGRLLAALLLVPTALFAATALVRVQAQTQEPQAPAAAPATGQAHPESAAEPAVVADSNPEDADADEPATADVTEDEVAPKPVAPVAPVAPVSPARASGVRPLSAPAASFPAAPALPAVPSVPAPHAPSLVISPGVVVASAYGQDGPTVTLDAPAAHGSSGHSYIHGKGYSYSYSSNGDSYALITGKDHDKVHFSGEWHNGPNSDIEKARRIAKGDFLWFMRDGKSYVVDDPSVVAQIQEMYRPIEELGTRQEELSKQQEALGKQQEQLGQRQEQATIPAPDLSKQMSALHEQMAKLEALTGGTVTQEQLAELQGRLGDLQGELGELQGKMGDRIGQLGAEQGRLGERQGELGARQGELGAQQARLATEIDRKMKSIIDQSLQNGKAKPVQ